MSNRSKLFFILLAFILKAPGQEVVGNAEIFLPGIVSLETTWDEYLSFSPDGNLLTFTRSGSDLPHFDRRIYFSYKVDEKWSEPILAPFSGDFFDRGSSFSPDGNRIYFGSNRPGDRGFDYDSDIWYSSKAEDGWSEAKRMPDLINSDEFNEGHPYVAKSGSLYFVRYKRGVETDIYVSKWENEDYQQPYKLNDNINTDGPDSHCYIDPDERFLIFTPTDREGGMGAGDVYISYFEDGDWQAPVCLGKELSTELYEYSAKPGPGGRLYFTRAKFGSDGIPADIYSVEVRLD
ncbi:WD40-like Beta Propeller Repeat [Ekhidna lutea]|uniref:WD40-like Beta Propeller Repeat n=1 Tax=Ekhidna lutea TaxID=447679 RepID=A0A239EI49_EKHLU|nr:PD40 domain-containing protein [Ekhidna lutea]SNS44091.1 WD40-like Beta Propeller Repeat [Ekhidna lutea]